MDFHHFVSRWFLSFVIAPGFLFLPLGANATDPVVFAHSEVTVTDSDLVEYLSERLLPEAYESALQRPGAVAQAVGNIFIIREAARLAREAGLVRPDREIWEARNAKDRYAMNRYVADQTKQRMLEVNWSVVAREEFMVMREDRAPKKEIDVSHILISSERYGFRELAQKVSVVSAALEAGRPFGEIASEFSDDPSVQYNAGHIGFIGAGDTDPAFEAAAFALAEVGAVSEPVLSSYGVHFIRFEGERVIDPDPYEKLEPFLIERLKKARESQYREAILEPIRAEANAMLYSLDEAAVSKRILEKLQQYGEDM